MKRFVLALLAAAVAGGPVASSAWADPYEKPDLVMLNSSRWHPKKPVFLMEPNPDFAAGMERALAARGRGTNTPIILMCRSGGDRSGPAAWALDGRGLEAVYVVVDGFEGVTSKDDPDLPFRNVNGWKNSGWPWGYVFDREKVYTRPAPAE